MKVRVDPGLKIPASEQVRTQVASLIERGRLVPGSRLPPIRALAADLGLAPNTVARAYLALESSGYVVGRGRHGTFVADALPERPDAAEALLGRAARAYVMRARQLGFDTGSTRRALDRALRSR